MSIKRCKIIRMTTEARVLKELRLENKLSMREAGFQIGKSDGYISHIENGRMDIPEGDTLQEILSIYHTNLNEFNDKVLSFKEEVPRVDILWSLLKKLDESKIESLIRFTENILNQNLILGSK